MTVTIEIENRQKRIPLSPARIRRIIRTVLHHKHVREATLSLAFVTDGAIRALNRKFLRRDHATDVLAFDLSGDERSRRAARATRLEGEIVISTAAACRNARRFATSPQEETVLYVVHGILHLLGYDDHGSADVRRMRLQERRLMAVLREKKLLTVV